MNVFYFILKTLNLEVFYHVYWNEFVFNMGGGGTKFPLVNPAKSEWMNQFQIQNRMNLENITAINHRAVCSMHCFNHGD